MRDATPDDAATCAGIYAPYVTATTVGFEEQPPREEEMGRRIADAQERHAWLVAEVDDVVRGYAYADHRGRGVGRSLYVALLDWMASDGIRLAVAAATLPNEASEALHRSLGFEVVGTFHDGGFKQARLCDVRWYQKRLVG